MLGAAIGLVIRTLLSPRAVFTEPLGHTAASTALIACAAAICLDPLLFLALDTSFGVSVLICVALPAAFIAAAFVLGAVLFLIGGAIDATPSFDDTCGLVAQCLLPLALPPCAAMLFSAPGWPAVVLAVLLSAPWCLYVLWVGLVDGLQASPTRVLVLGGVLFCAMAGAGAWRVSVVLDEKRAAEADAIEKQRADSERRLAQLKRKLARDEALAHQQAGEDPGSPAAPTRRWSLEIQSVPPGAEVRGPTGSLGPAPVTASFDGFEPVTLLVVLDEVEKRITVSRDDGPSVVVAMDAPAPRSAAPPKQAVKKKPRSRK